MSNILEKYLEDQSKIELANDIISLVLANEESSYKEACENKKFYSIILMNLCYSFFDMPKINNETSQFHPHFVNKEK